MKPKRSHHWLIETLILLIALSPGPLRGQPTAQRATLHVRLPADAKLMVDGKPTQQTGPLRHFYTPPLEPGKRYHYTFTWTFQKGGKTAKGEEIVYFQAGDDKEYNLVGVVTRPDMDKKPLAGQDDETADKTQTKKPARKPDVNYVPSPPEVVDKMLELADLKKDDVLYDLGCGDGRIVIAAAKKYKCKAVGIEIDPQLVHEARDKVKAEGLEKLVEIQEGDIFKTDLEPASVVTMYLLDHLNAKLVPQLQKLKPGTRIVSHDFKIADYPPDKTVTVELRKVGLNPNVYLWVAPLKKKGDKGK